MTSNTFVARANLAFLEDAEVEPHPAAFEKPVLETLDAHLERQLVAGNAGLADLDQGATDAEHVADAHLVVEHALDGEVLAELADGEIVTPGLARPVVVVLVGIGIYRAESAAVTP